MLSGKGKGAESISPRRKVSRADPGCPRCSGYDPCFSKTISAFLAVSFCLR